MSKIKGYLETLEHTIFQSRL